MIWQLERPPTTLVAQPGGEHTSAKFVLQFEGEPDPLIKPISVAVDKQGHVYVIDQSNLRIQKFDPTAGP